MHHHCRYIRVFFPIFSLCLVLATLACSGSISPTPRLGTLLPASQQVLRFPNVGIADANSAFLDPAQGPDANTDQVVEMIYSGLVKVDINLNVIPDQATSWDVSPNGTVYTFHLRQGLAFSDGTPISAQTYVDTLTRALLPEVNSPIATFFEGAIVGANDVNNGKTKTLAGVKALDAQTLQITLTQPTPYFLEVLTRSLYFALNKRVIAQYGQVDWPNHVAGSAVGSGPFMVKAWSHRQEMVLVPNPYYYGTRPKLREVDMFFVNDPPTALKAYRANQYDFIWNITPNDQQTVSNVAGFTRKALLETDLLFFHTKISPFNNPVVRQAFAYAIDRKTLVHAIFKDTVVEAPTIIPPGMPGYQPNYPGIPFDKIRAKTLLLSVYPDVSKVPPITFTYPSSQVTPAEASALQQMWEQTLFLHVTLHPIDLSTYNHQTAQHQIQFGIIQWSADFPDPYDWLTLNLFSNAGDNSGEWSNADFDRTVTQAEKSTGDARIALYNQAEQIAIQDVGWLPLDHEAMAAIIPSWLHGVTLNGRGLFFSDWSNVYILQH